MGDHEDVERQGRQHVAISARLRPPAAAGAPPRTSGTASNVFRWTPGPTPPTTAREGAKASSVITPSLDGLQRTLTYCKDHAENLTEILRRHAPRRATRRSGRQRPQPGDRGGRGRAMPQRRGDGGAADGADHRGADSQTALSSGPQQFRDLIGSAAAA